MQVLRLSPVPIFLACVAGVCLLGVSHTPGGDANQFLQTAGYWTLVGGVLSFVVVLWGGVYLEVREASRGHPGLRAIPTPEMPSEAAAKLRAFERSLTSFGFRHDEWFKLDDFPATHVSAWQHESRPTAAFILYYPDGGLFRLRFVRRFASGGVVVTSTRMCDLAYPPPQGIYLQARKWGARVDELWAWHLEAEGLFPDATDPAPGDPEFARPRDLFVAVSARWGTHRRRDRTWLLAVEPIGELWRMYHLTGMPLREQFELGWTNPYWQ